MLHSNQITQSISCAPNSPRNCPPATSYQPIPCQLYQSGQSQYVYQRAEEKEIYQVDNKVLEELEEELLDGEIYYTNEHYNELQVNFVRIESVCDQCTTVFHFQSALQKHIKNKYTPLQEAIAETSPSPSFARPILKFTARLFAPGSGLAFRG